MRILVVEDDRLLNNTLCYNLDAAGYVVDSALTKSAASDFLTKQDYDLIVLDVNLPDGNGFDFCREVKERRPNTAVIFLTANDMESDMLKGYELGAEDYVTKPFPMSVFQKKLSVVLGRLAKQSGGGDSYEDGALSINFSEMTACGNHGCVERVVGENALTERAEACGIDLTRFAGRKPLYCDIGAMAEDGDAHAKELIKDLAVDLSFAISNLITLFNPSLVVIGGMGVNLGPFFLSNIRDEVQNSGFKEFVSNTWIQYSTLGLDSELGGAARYYIDHYYDFFEQMQGGLYAD